MTKFPHHFRKVSLRQLGLYGLVLRYFQHLWSEEVQLVADTASVDSGEPFVAVAIKSYSHVHVHGLRYGSFHTHRGKGSSYAYIDGRQPVRINYILYVEHIRRDHMLPQLEHACAIVQRFVRDDSIPEMPWELRYVSPF